MVLLLMVVWWKETIPVGGFPIELFLHDFVMMILLVHVLCCRCWWDDFVDSRTTCIFFSIWSATKRDFFLPPDKNILIAFYLPIDSSIGIGCRLSLLTSVFVLCSLIVDCCVVGSYITNLNTSPGIHDWEVESSQSTGTLNKPGVEIVVESFL